MTHPATLKIVCLHGYCQNAQLFRLKTGGLRKSLQRSISAVRNDSTSNPPLQIPMAELYYLDAPFVLEQRLNPQPRLPGQRLSETDTFKATFQPAPLRTSPDEPHDMAKRSWWIAQNDGKICVGWEQTLEYLLDVFRQQKFDGILGFSQGAIVTSLISSLRGNANPAYPELSSLRFAIMVSGFPVRATALQNLYNQPIAMPSMHVWGVEDKIIPNYGSRNLLEKFHHQDRNCIVHPKGHLVPSDADSRQAICRFVLQYAAELNALFEERLRAAL